MKLNVVNNFKAIYYNTLTNFYLYFNTFVPYYDDVILTLSITSFKNIIKSSKIKLKENRLLQLIYTLDDKDNIVVDDDGFVFVDYYIKDTEATAEATDTDDDADATNTVIHNEVVADTCDTVADTVADTCDTVADTCDTVADTVADTCDTVADTVADTCDTVCYNSIEKKNN